MHYLAMIQKSFLCNKNITLASTTYSTNYLLLQHECDNMLYMYYFITIYISTFTS